MTKRKIHIVSFDVPFPADYGGVIDVFYRIKALAELNFDITLHCFEYGRGQQDELKEYVSKIIYYRRKKSVFTLLNRKPFIIASRENSELLNNLNIDDSPILFEGLHTCAFLGHTRLENRIKWVRTHNIEHNYYQGLANSSAGWKRVYFNLEAKKLKKFEVILKHANHIFAIQEKDVVHFKKINSKVKLLPASVPDLKGSKYITTKPYCLYHGNLSVIENQQAIVWLMNNVTLPDGVKLMIAGKNPTKEITKLGQMKDVDIEANPSEEKMIELISEARVHLLHTEQATGLKLKLINALNSPGHVIVNPLMVEGTNLNDLCHIGKSGREFSKVLADKISEPLTEQEYIERKKVVSSEFNTKNNLDRLLKSI